MSMPNKIHLSILDLGVENWNQWRNEHPDEQPDLINANLRDRDLSNANFSGAKLMWTNLRNTNLTGTIFMGANLSNSTLRGAIVNGTLFSKADLSVASLRGLDLRGANFMGATLYGANLSNTIMHQTWFKEANLIRAQLNSADLRGADLQFTLMVNTEVEGAILTDCLVHGASVWLLEGTPKDQSNLVITPSLPPRSPRDDADEPYITVDELEVAQFLYLLLNHKKLREVINSVTRRGVLLLGRFSDGGLEVLQAIAEKLRSEKYLPIIFNFDRPEGRNYTETVQTLVGLSRFVIVDLSGPSVPLELHATVPHYKIPFVPVLEEGRTYASMLSDILDNAWVLKPIVTFSSVQSLLDEIPLSIIAPAEDLIRNRNKKLSGL